MHATWRARAGSGSPMESWENFGKRIGAIRIRFILDESVTIHQRIYVTADKETPIIPVQKEVALRNDKETWLRFPMDAGRIQIHLAGAQPNDMGIIRVEFLVPLFAPDDNMILPSTMDCVELYDIDPDEFPEPHEPNPFAEVKLTGNP